MAGMYDGILPEEVKLALHWNWSFLVERPIYGTHPELPITTRVELFKKYFIEFQALQVVIGELAGEWQRGPVTDSLCERTSKVAQDVTRLREMMLELIP